LILFFAILGICQMALQGVVPKMYLFPVDYLTPRALLIQGYNNLNTLNYGSTFLKSNGVFLAEPSYLSQIVGLGIILEFSTRRRIGRVVCLFLALYSTFSGTGVVMIAIWSLYLAVKTGKSLIYLVIAPIFIAGIFIIGPQIGLNVLLSRADEFSDPNSSGFARFVSMFYMLGEVNFSDFKEMFFGRGSGTVFEFSWLFHFEIFDPTWGKILYEFGVLGFAAFVIFYASAIRIQSSILALPITVLYFVLGGYFLDASIIGIMTSLVIWICPRRPNEAVELSPTRSPAVIAVSSNG
jgi:hypothetical protein